MCTMLLTYLFLFFLVKYCINYGITKDKYFKVILCKKYPSFKILRMGIMKCINKPKKVNSDKFDLESVIARLLNSDKKKTLRLKSKPVVTEEEIDVMCKKVNRILINQPMLLQLTSPVNICGDIHGQFSDLKTLFSVGGYPPYKNYLFLGDYVDRGSKSVETLCLLMAFKIKFSENFFILRGNHENDTVNKLYGFYDECKRKYSVKVWKTFNDTFRCLPVAAVIENKIFCCHGGISPHLQSLDQIRHIDRPCSVPPDGLMGDLLWADPSDLDGFLPNEVRGRSVTFGPRQVEEFLEKFGFDLLCRAHEVEEDGYRFFSGRNGVTVFSAPNYCGRRGNYGGIMVVKDDLRCQLIKFKGEGR